ncbi:hypothetical protein B7463_g4869, partial [Scytalidium lignicola]
MESKPDAASVSHSEYEAHAKHAQQHAGQEIEVAQLFEEDANGNVTARFLLPRPTDDPKDPLVNMERVEEASGSFIWAAVAQSWGSLLGARIVQGFGASSSEALGPSVIADLYFLHERGTKMGFYTLMIASGKTNFRRSAENETSGGVTESNLTEIRARARPSWIKSLSLTSWYEKETSIWWLWRRPFLTLQYPAVIWGSLTYGVSLGWVVLQQTAGAVAFPELYGFGRLATGNINIANLIGAIIGCIIGGPCSDYVVSAITKRRGGFFKPEFRLWCIIPAIIFGPIGLMLWGCGLGNHMASITAIAGSGITYAVLCAVPSIGMTYVVDSYRPLAGETMTVLTAFKNTFAFGLSFGVEPWINSDGYVKVAGFCVLIEGVSGQQHNSV